MGLLPRGPEGLAPGADGGQKELRVGAQKEEAGIGGALLDEFEQDVLPRLVQQFRVLQEVDLPWRLVGQDVGVRPKGRTASAFSPSPSGSARTMSGWIPWAAFRQLAQWPQGGASRCTPRRRPAGPPAGGGSPHHQVGVGQLPLGHAGFRCWESSTPLPPLCLGGGAGVGPVRTLWVGCPKAAPWGAAPWGPCLPGGPHFSREMGEEGRGPPLDPQLYSPLLPLASFWGSLSLIRQRGCFLRYAKPIWDAFFRKNMLKSIL